MRAFTAHTVAVALSLDPKWLDNLLSQNEIEGCIRVRQGVGRRLSQRGVLHVAVIADLTRSLRIPVRIAREIARGLLGRTGEVNRKSTDSAVFLEMTSALALRLDLDALERSSASSLALAVETARRPRRGRPPATPRRSSA